MGFREVSAVSMKAPAHSRPRRRRRPWHQHPERAAGSGGLASVNPIFTWVRLAQRVPVRIHINQLPDGVRLVASMTATVQIDA
jgi:hypothetical protein